MGTSWCNLGNDRGIALPWQAGLPWPAAWTRGGKGAFVVLTQPDGAGGAARGPAGPPMIVELSGRDLAIVQLVTRFKQATTAHVYELLFTTASRSPCDIALHRLTKQHYLHRIERRAVGGRRGGSGQYVYALGRRGFFMSSVGNYRPARTVDYHALQIVETYLALQRLHVAGQLTIAGYSTEPDCWQTVGQCHFL